MWPFSVLSCLFLCSFASGCMALPVLMNIKQVIEQRQCSGVWTHKDELPVSSFEFLVFLVLLPFLFHPSVDSHHVSSCRLKLTSGRSAGTTLCSPARSSGSRPQRAILPWSSSVATSSPEMPSTNWLTLGSKSEIQPAMWLWLWSYDWYVHGRIRLFIVLSWITTFNSNMLILGELIPSN